MKWSEREWLILQVIAFQSTGVKFTPEVLRDLIESAAGKTVADVDALLKGGAK